MFGNVAGKRLRVINAGAPGYTTYQAYAFLRYYSDAIAPDAVLLYCGINDYLPVTYLQRRAKGAAVITEPLTDWQLHRRRRAPRARIHQWLHDELNLYRILFKLIGGHPAGRRKGQLRAKRDQARVPDTEREMLLDKIVALCEQRGIELAIIIPWYVEFETHIPLLRRFALTRDVPLVDLPVEFCDLPGERIQYFLDPVHPNAEGHRLMAERIAQVVKPRWK